MIVQCEKCESKFNLDPALIKPTGTVVRCGICKNVFIVHPEIKEETPPQTLFEEEKREEPPLHKLFEEEESVQKKQIEEQAEKLEEGPPDTFKELFGEEPETKKEEVISEEPPLAQEVKAPAKKRNTLIWALAIGVPVILAILIGLFLSNLLGKSFLDFSKIGIPDIAGIFQKKQDKQEADDPGNKKLSLYGVSGKFVKSEKGNIFVITGNVRNRYSNKRKDILVRANLLDKQGNTLKSETAYAGNKVSDDELSKGNMEIINGKLKNVDPQNVQSRTVEPGATIQFMVVFFDMPANVSEFTVQTLESKPLKESK